MTIGVDDARHVARLAELAVPEAELPLLASQLERIVAFVAQLGDAELGEGAEPVVMGPARTPLREDVVAPVPLARPVASIAPEFVDGLFVVPKLGGLAEG